MPSSKKSAFAPYSLIGLVPRMRACAFPQVIHCIGSRPQLLVGWRVVFGNQRDVRTDSGTRAGLADETGSPRSDLVNANYCEL